MAGDCREEGGDDVNWEGLVGWEKEDEHLETVLARLRGGCAVESRGNLGRPERS